MCGTCGRTALAECTCGKAAEMRAELAKLVAHGKNRDQIHQYDIEKYGSQEPLARRSTRDSTGSPGSCRTSWAPRAPA